MDLHDAINCLKLKLDQRGASQREASDALLAAGQLVAQHVLLVSAALLRHLAAVSYCRSCCYHRHWNLISPHTTLFYVE